MQSEVKSINKVLDLSEVSMQSEVKSIDKVLDDSGFSMNSEVSIGIDKKSSLT